jgi:hypothetical protein
MPLAAKRPGLNSSDERLRSLIGLTSGKGSWGRGDGVGQTGDAPLAAPSCCPSTDDDHDSCPLCLSLPCDTRFTASSSI